MVFLMMEIPNQPCNIVWAIFLSHCTEILNLKEQNVTPESWLHKSQFHCCVLIYSTSTSLACWQIRSGVEQHMCHCADALGRDGCGSWVGEAEGPCKKKLHKWYHMQKQPLGFKNNWAGSVGLSWIWLPDLLSLRVRPIFLGGLRICLSALSS